MPRRERPAERTQPTAPIRVCLLSLGCAKNLVDSEVILGRVGEQGLAVASRPEDADVIVVNTCGFIGSAREESVDTILRMCELKEAAGGPRKVVVAGCLGQRYGEELRKEIPEVDAIIGLGEYAEFGRIVRDLFRAEDDGSPRGGPLVQVGDPTRACHAEVGRFRLTPPHFAYVKISEGCDNPCTFCAIPAIRGRFRSKPIPAIRREVEELVSSGAKELLLISQDTTSYGADLTGKLELPRLLEEVAGIRGVDWIRVLYAYPAFLTDEMVDAIAGIDRVVKYLDIPLQHISDRMLRKMGRRLNGDKTRALLDKLRDRVPGIYLRTTFLVGFPGETEEDFETLRDFVETFRFERLGVFTYSREEGTPAAGFPDPVPETVARRRAQEIMLTQQRIAFRQNRGRRGEVVRAIVDEEVEGGGRKRFRARSAGEAPEIDPSILVAGGGGGRRPDRPAPRPGDFVTVRITGSREYDLRAVLEG